MSLRVGAHASIAGGVHNAVDEQREFGGNCGQIFSHSPQVWQDPDIEADNATQFREESAEHDLGPWVIHASYLVNLATPKEDLREKSIRSLQREADAAATLGVEYVNIHLGAHTGAGVERGLENAASALDELEVPEGVTVLVESDAGSGTKLGGEFEHLATVLGESDRDLEVCLDTAHAFAAGYDLSTPPGVDDTFEITVAVEPDGTAEFTKPNGTGGKVTTGTIAEQVLYEVADPAKYYGPDVIADFQYAELEQVGNDRVGLTGIEGKPPTDRYKASLHYHDGWQVRGSLVYSQPNAVAKCEKAIESIREKADAAGVDYRRFYSERFGANALHASAASGDVEEVAARVNIVTDSKGDGYKFGSLLPPMGMAGPPGTTMFSPGRPSPSPNYAYHPVLVPKDTFDPNVEVMEV